MTVMAPPSAMAAPPRMPPIAPAVSPIARLAPAIACCHKEVRLSRLDWRRNDQSHRNCRKGNISKPFHV